MRTTPPAHPEARPTASGGMGKIGEGISKLFSKDAMWGLLLGAIIGLLFGGNLEVTAGLALAGAALGSGAVGEVFGGVKELLGSFMGGGKSEPGQQVAQNRQADQPDGPDQGVAPGYTPGYSPNTGRSRG